MKIKSIKNISRKIGFTETEFSVLLFLSFVFLTGLIFQQFISPENKIDKKQISSGYLLQDSLFFASDRDSLFLKNGKLTIDNEQELSDFSNNKFEQREKISVQLGEKSIDINEADMKTLCLLPGIGEKTAEKIIEYRKNYGKFNRIEDIKKVKGIGEKKFNNIKKYIFVK
ncbi:MAG: helix-hairpin-helix domain-containing protein [Ignavibacteriales bacterium]|nr:helix-hairpin-helix domain-containing protein [Ignavibacteriales bacterium]